MGQQITIDLDDLLDFEDGFDIRGAVISEAANVLFEDAREEIKQVIRQSVKERTEQFVNENIQKVFGGTFVPTDCYGNPRTGAAPKTMCEIVMEEARKSLTEMVDRDGRSGGYGSSKEYTRLQFAAMKAAEDAIKKELEPELKKAKEEFVRSCRGKLAQAFHAALAEAVKQ